MDDAVEHFRKRLVTLPTEYIRRNLVLLRVTGPNMPLALLFQHRLRKMAWEELVIRK